MEAVADRLKINPLHMCYHAQFRRTSLKRVITKGEPQIGEHWGTASLEWGVSDP